MKRKNLRPENNGPQLASADARTAGVTQPVNRNEQKKELTWEEREKKLWEQIFYEIICQKCQLMLLEVKSKSDLGFEKAKELTKIQGILTSNLRTRKSTDVPYMAFIKPENANQKHSWAECEKQKCQECEIPIIFRIGKPNDYYKPLLRKGHSVLLTGSWAKSDHSSRASFTCSAYQVINSHEE